MNDQIEFSQGYEDPYLLNLKIIQQKEIQEIVIDYQYAYIDVNKE